MASQPHEIESKIFEAAFQTENVLPGVIARKCGGFCVPLWVGKFLKTVTCQRMTPAASIEVGEVTGGNATSSGCRRMRSPRGCGWSVTVLQSLKFEAHLIH